jgi:glycosyltransferase involved in cell wall biosynthesis
MKLLFYSHAFAPHVGGIETFSMHLVRGLAAANAQEGEPISVTVVTQTAGPPDTNSLKMPFQVIRRPGAKRLWELIGHAEKVILAGPAILPLVFALMRRKPVMVTHHAYQANCPNGLLFYVPTQSACPGHFAAGHYSECVRCNRPQEGFAASLKSLLLTFLRRRMCRVATSNVAVTNHVARRIALPRTLVILHGVPVVPRAESTSSGNAQDPVCFAYIGRLVSEKGVPTLLDAARLLKERKRPFRILIVGDGPEHGRLQNMVSTFSLEEEVSFAGSRTGNLLEKVLTGVSALVVPSIWEEAAGLSALEQMMRGRLIIGSNIGGLAEQIDDDGLRFAAGDSAALADQMERVIQDPACIPVLGSRARDRAMNLYSLEHMLQEYRILLQRL